MMVDLSKELGEIKRRHDEDSAFGQSAWKDLHDDRGRLYEMLKIDLPELLRNKARKTFDQGEFGLTAGILIAIRAIESLTKKEEA